MSGQQPVSSHVQPQGAEPPNQHFAPESWQPFYRELSARHTYEDKIRYILSAPQTTFNGDSTDADIARRRDQKSTHAIHIKRRWEKKRKKLVASARPVASTVILSPVEVRKKTSGYYPHHNKARSVQHAVFNEKEHIVEKIENIDSRRSRRYVLVSSMLPIAAVNGKSKSNSSWEPVALFSSIKHKTNNNLTFINKKMLHVEQLDNHTLNFNLNASALESSGYTSFSNLGLVARFKKSDELEWVEIALKNDSHSYPPATRATYASVPRPRSTFQSPYNLSIISLSPEVPNLVKKFIGQSHVDLMKPETLVVKYQQSGEPQITGIYTTSPTVDGTLFGIVNSNARPNYYDRPNIFDSSPLNHNHRPPLFDDVGPMNQNHLFTPPFHNFNHDNRPLQPLMPQAPNPTIYSNFVPSGPSIFNNLGQHVPALPPIFDDLTQAPIEPPLDFEHTHFATVQQVNKPSRPFRPSFASGVISGTVIGIAEAPVYHNNRPQNMHGGNYQYQAPDEPGETLVDDVSEDSLLESSEKPEVVVDEISEEEVDFTRPTVPPVIPSTTLPQTVASEIPHPAFTTTQTPTVIYGGIPVPIKPVLSHDPSCPNLTIIVSPTITNNNIQHIITAPPSHTFRPPNYPPPNFGGSYDFRPPSPFPAKPPISYSPTVTRPPLIAQQQVPPSDDAPVEYVDPPGDDAEFANQEATAPPATEAPPASSEAPPVSEVPPVTDAPGGGGTTVTVRPPSNFLADLANVFLNTSSPFFWLALTSPVVIMLAMLVGMTHYMVPSWRSTSTSDHHDPVKHIPQTIVVAKHKYKTTTKKPPKKKKRPPRGQPAGVPGVLWGRSFDNVSDVNGRRRRRYLNFGVT